MAKTVKKTSAQLRRIQRKPAKTTWGGVRKNAGRPALFTGKHVKVTVKLTTEARDLVMQTAKDLEPEHGPKATIGAAMEYLIRKATGRLPEPWPHDE